METITIKGVSYEVVENTRRVVGSDATLSRLDAEMTRQGVTETAGLKRPHGRKLFYAVKQNGEWRIRAEF